MPSKKANKKATPQKANGKSANATAAAKPANKKNTTGGHKKIKGQLPTYLPVPEGKSEEEIHISDEDVEFFTQNTEFGKFLSSLDSKELTRNETKVKKTMGKATPKPIAEPMALSSSDDEDYDDDSDLSDMGSDGEDVAMESDSDSDVIDSDEGLEEAVAAAKEATKTKQQSKKATREQFKDSDEEQDYETMPRKVADEWTRKDYTSRLPIKLPGGKIVEKNVEPEEDAPASDSKPETADESASEPEEEEATEETEPVEEEAPKLTKKQYLLAKKEELAKIASTILEDPMENISDLKKLRALYTDEQVTVKKLALLTQLAVYKDIIPGYRIRPLTEKEKAVKVSKEVKIQRDYEETLVQSYEAYIGDLNKVLMKNRKMEEEDEALSIIAARCLCELLTTKTHFNFRLEIMVTVVARMSTMKWGQVADMCTKAIAEVFDNDTSGRVSLDAVKMMTRMIKSKNYVVHENVIHTFLHLRLKDELPPVNSDQDNNEQTGKKRKKQDRPFLNKKARKALKETKEIEKEFKEAQAEVDVEVKEKHQTETLKLLFAFYFRIIKKNCTSPLLPAVLLGLAKFAHLINVDFFDDLLNALRDVMGTLVDKNDGSTADAITRKRLLCITTAFELLSGQGEALNYDLKTFYADIYNILFKAAFHTKIEERPSPEIASEIEMIYECLELMLIKKRQIPINRMAAFVKRFTIVALNMPTKSVLQCLNLVKRLALRDHRLDALMQSEDRAASGVYLPYLEDPELCNPFGTSLYELFLYQNHYDPRVRDLARSIQQPAIE